MPQLSNLDSLLISKAKSYLGIKFTKHSTLNPHTCGPSWTLLFEFQWDC